MLRTLLERLARSKVIKRHLPPRFGKRPIYISPDAALQYLKPDLQETFCGTLFDVAARYLRAGEVVWDIGANVGFFSLAAAHCVGGSGRVVAFEPDPFLASLVQRSALEQANQSLRLDIFCAAVSNADGIAQFIIAERGRSSNALAETGTRGMAGGARYTQSVPTYTMDSLLQTFAAPQFIKVDVEGAETLVLEGGQTMLSKHRPAFFIEVGAEQSPRVSALFHQHEYVLFDFHDPTRSPQATAPFDTLACPKESALSFLERSPKHFG